MTTKHGRGPWVLEKHTGEIGEPLDSFDDWTIRDADGYKVCMEYCSLTRRDELVRANVALLLAAPDMLEALRKAVVLLAGACMHSPVLGPHDTYEAVSAAIAKATGVPAFGL